jgi:hypothetical protein
MAGNILMVTVHESLLLMYYESDIFLRIFNRRQVDQQAKMAAMTILECS